jgi:hypothetical protein
MFNISAFTQSGFGRLVAQQDLEMKINSVLPCIVQISMQIDEAPSRKAAVSKDDMCGAPAFSADRKLPVCLPAMTACLCPRVTDIIKDFVVNVYALSCSLNSADGRNISPECLDSLIEEHREGIEKMGVECGTKPSFFEVLTALAIKYFANKGAQCVIMEAGLGGVLDATNVFQKRQVCEHKQTNIYSKPCFNRFPGSISQTHRSHSMILLVQSAGQSSSVVQRRGDIGGWFIQVLLYPHHCLHAHTLAG